MASFVYVFTLYPASKKGTSSGPSVLDFTLMLMGSAICIYVMSEADEFISHPTKCTVTDFALSVVTVRTYGRGIKAGTWLDNTLI